MTQERIFFITVIDTLESIYNGMRRAGEAIVAPLRSGNGPNKFRLSAVDTATTTHDGDDGWAKRPPATVACPRCENDILQHNAYDDIDCPRCVASFDADEFSELELRGLTCPVCRDDMVHGQRHPEAFDIVEWATCNSCRYHWEFKHSYD
ncbi:hypothetical protein [Haloquadratum walsbyi]|jgi:Zn-finger nucleic acid-binding protein|uniref:Uncharacterized protein n=1 Tax=Haloquadratum walsbyi (strain DSM 16790 / HBSQ001) TaxID=362976 RepID=Q18EZ5_HALWD|nr:uncharacterized protein HQ_3372A [Haloquadratum walsbyi DSM 16790]